MPLKQSNQIFLTQAMVAITQGVGRRLQEVGKSCSTLAGDDLRAIVAITRMSRGQWFPLSARVPHFMRAMVSIDRKLQVGWVWLVCFKDNLVQVDCMLLL